MKKKVGSPEGRLLGLKNHESKNWIDFDLLKVIITKL